ncbi:DAO domain-containing protein [Mycena sanguinolenta]|uniref:DAO domain-containing protein n=1 Tax=Mycena sanguinolenta TaxID=230812 RepID=A0A8H6ZK32_9AGAR|nr:DAO domain-containing protein [Mycena sanguinolenta]
MAHDRNGKILIVGAGCFGLSTALALLKRGWTDVTVIDRAATLPAPDGASNDINRVVRTSYSDDFYSKLAFDAIREWKTRDKWHDAYHESGVLVLGSGSVDYAHKAYLHDRDIGLRVVPLDSQATFHQVFMLQAHLGTFENRTGYLNRDSGWANAGQGVKCIMDQVAALNGKIILGKDVVELIQHGQKTTGVRCVDGTVFDALELVVLATGSWTGSAFPDLPIGNIFQATGQCIAMVQLTPEEADMYKECPVVLDFALSFCIFPPNEQNMVKLATHKCKQSNHNHIGLADIHAAGYVQSIGAKNISTPRTITSDPYTGLLIPKADVKELREQLRMVYPALAEKPFVATRMCWYNDSFDDDWVIGYHPKSDKSLMFATAGSGHAYKFLPVIGQLVADAIEGKLSPQLVNKFALDRTPNQFGERRDQLGRQELDLSQLCTPEDLL